MNERSQRTSRIGRPFELAAHRLRKFTTTQGRADVRYAVSRKVLNPVFQRLGFVVVADHFYQPLLTDRARAALGNRARRLAAIGTDDHAALFDQVLGSYGPEFHGPQGPAAALGYDPTRSQIGPGDQETLWAMIRHLQPKRVVEIGAGGSTLVIAAALAANGGSASLRSVEPFPSAWLRDGLRGVPGDVDVSLEVARLQDVGAGVVDELEAGDVLFVDSTHVYRPGSDVEYEFLELYPRLAPGVVVHLHDIFLPADYPEDWDTRHRRYWNEQHVLEAVLANADRYRVLLPLAHLAETRREVFERHLGRTFAATTRPGSMWLEVQP